MPWKIGEYEYVDGGVSCNLPVNYLKSHDKIAVSVAFSSLESKIEKNIEQELQKENQSRTLFF